MIFVEYTFVFLLGAALGPMIQVCLFLREADLKVTIVQPITPKPLDKKYSRKKSLKRDGN